MNLTVINRQCNISNISLNKSRPAWFDREKCFNSLYQELPSSVDFIVFFDGTPEEDHFINSYDVNVVKIDCGSGSNSYKKSLDYALSRKSDLFYFVEDDYLHKPNWFNILLEGYEKNFDYFTLYDHSDKYSILYKELESKIYTSQSCHWRTTPSTTDTFACKRKTLIEDLDIHKYFSSIFDYSLDHQRFISLANRNRILASSIPGYSTHVEDNLLSPTVDWSLI